jgi:hypothetical protein
MNPWVHSGEDRLEDVDVFSAFDRPGLDLEKRIQKLRHEIASLALAMTTFTSASLMSGPAQEYWPYARGLMSLYLPDWEDLANRSERDL